MIYIRKQTSLEIANITIVQGESIQLFGTQGYTVSQLQSINNLLGMNDCMICIDCDLGISQEDEDLIYNLNIIEFLSNVRHLLVSNFPHKAELDSIDFVQYTPLLQSLSILGLIKRSISLQSLQELKFLDTLNFGDYLEITKKQLSVINSLTNLKELEVKKMDASSLNPNFNMKKLSIFSKLTNGECLPDKFPNLEYLYLKRQTKCSDFSWISKLVNLKRLYLHWTFSLETLPDLSKLSNLELLELAGCPNLRYGIDSVRYLPKLQRFVATDLTCLTTEELEKTLFHLKTLKSVYIYFRNNNAENKAMEKLMKKYNWVSHPNL
jgi:hypothetical protein